MTVPSLDLIITFQYDNTLYKFNKSIIQVRLNLNAEYRNFRIFITQTPMLVPGLNYSFEALVECLSDKGISDTVKVITTDSKMAKLNKFLFSKVFVLKKNRSVPIIAAIINMPISEAMVVV